MTGGSGKIRIGIVDDHPLYREGVAFTIREQSEFEVVGLGANGTDALQIARREKPHIMLVDLSMRDGGAPLVTRLHEIDPGLKVVILTVSDAETHVSETLRAGACGYVLKSASGNELLAALRSIGAGDSYVMPELAAKLLTQMQTKKAAPRRPAEGIDCLNVREEGILRLVSSGATNKEIARSLDISEKTVKHYMTTILQKLNVRNRVEAASLMIQSNRQGASQQTPNGKP